MTRFYEWISQNLMILPFRKKRVLIRISIFTLMITSLLSTYLVSENYPNIALRSSYESNIGYYPDFRVKGTFQTNSSFDSINAFFNNLKKELFLGTIFENINCSTFIHLSIPITILNQPKIENTTLFYILGLSDEDILFFTEINSLLFPKFSNETVLIQSTNTSSNYLLLEDSEIEIAFSGTVNQNYTIQLIDSLEANFQNQSFVDSLCPPLQYGNELNPIYFDTLSPSMLNYLNIHSFFGNYYSPISQGEIFLITSLTNLLYICNHIFGLSEVPVDYDIFFEKSILTETLYQKVYQSISQINQQFSIIKDSSEFYLELYSPIHQIILEFDQDYQKLQPIFIILSLIPFFGAVFLELSMNHFTLSEYHEEFRIIINKGASSLQLIGSLFFEIFSTYSLGLFLSLIIGVPFSSLLISSNNFLKFDGFFYIHIEMIQILYLLPLSFIMVLLSFRGPLISAIKMLNFQNHKQYTNRPFLLRHHYHIFAIVIGMIGYLAVRLIFQDFEFFSDYHIYIDKLRTSVALESIFLIIFAIGLLFTLPSLILHIISIFRELSKNLNSHILFLVFTSFKRRGNFVIVSIILISVLGTLMTFSVTFPSIQLNNETLNGITELGAEIIWETKITPEKTTLISNMQEIEGWSPFIEISFPYIQHKILGVNLIQYNSILQYYYYDKAPALTPIDHLNDSDDFCILQSNYMERIGKEIKNPYNYYLFENSSSREPIYWNFTIEGTYEWFPRLFYNDRGYYLRGAESILTNLITAEKILSFFNRNHIGTKGLYNIRWGYLIGSKTPKDVFSIKQKILEIDSIESTIILSKDIENFNSPRWKILFILSNSTILYSASFTLLSIVIFFLLFNHSRRYELAIERICGLNFIKLYISSIIPSSIIFILSFSFGVLFGIGFSILLNRIIPFLLSSSLFIEPPFQVNLQIPISIGFVQIIFILILGYRFVRKSLINDNPIGIL